MYFKVHQPVRLRQFQFSEIGKSSYYYDDSTNEEIISRIAANCYLPANKVILNLINHFKGQFKVAFSISGTTIDLFKSYAPEVIESFRNLADTGCVEFLAETYSHSLAVLMNKGEFCRQVESHSATIQALFGIRPTVFTNSEIVYSDEIGATLSELGFKGVLTDKPVHLNSDVSCVYHNTSHSGLKVLFKNKQLSDTISSRFSDYMLSAWPMTSQKFVALLNKIPLDEKAVNLFINYETFGEKNKFGSGIFKFLCSLPSEVLSKSDFEFSTPSDIIANSEPISFVSRIHLNSNTEHKQYYSPWVVNCFQQEAFEKLYGISDRISESNDPLILKDWQNLQTSDHFYYMTTMDSTNKSPFTDNSPYKRPYDAYINFMNVLNDLSMRLYWGLNKNQSDTMSQIKLDQRPE